MKRRRLSGDTGNCNPPEIDATKLPAERLLKTSDLPEPKDSKLWEEVLKELPVDILLLTVKDCELLSCVSHLNKGYIRSSHDNLGPVYFGLIGTSPTLKIAYAYMFTCSHGLAYAKYTFSNIGSSNLQF